MKINWFRGGALGAVTGHNAVQLACKSHSRESIDVFRGGDVRYYYYYHYCILMVLVFYAYRFSELMVEDFYVRFGDPSCSDFEKKN